MGRYTGPKNKRSRREGVDLTGTGGAALQRRIDKPPGDHGGKMRRGRVSDFHRQLREKQKVKRIYGMREQQFRRFVRIARNEPEMTGTALLKLLERRLDSVVYRGGLARTRAMARQMIVHGNVTVNDEKVSVPSFLVQPGMTVSVNNVGRKMPDVQWAMDAPTVMAPSWLSRDEFEVNVLDYPNRDEVEFPVEESLIVEFYSR